MIRDEVIKAVTFQGPDFVPLRIHDEFDRSDIIEIAYGPPDGWIPPSPDLTEWGFAWSKLDDTLGQVKDHVIDSYDKWPSYPMPDPHAPGRFREFEKIARQYPDRYLMGGLFISGFSQTTFLRGMDNVFMDLYLNREGYLRMLRDVIEFEKELIRGFARAGAHAIAFGDDWGTQKGLMIDPSLWREVFKPIYREQFELVHRLGMHVFFHTCGRVNEIVGDLIEAGVDMLNFNQIHLLGLEWVAARYAGKACFFMPCDNQRTMPSNDVGRITGEARLLMDTFGRFGGGFIGQAERYASLNFSEEAYEALIREFRVYGRQIYRSNRKDS